jgi:hypothetical protein
MTWPTPYESAVERQIRLAQEQGKFDDLPGKGKPLPGLDREYDEDWWVRAWVEREGVSREMLLPPALQLRKEIERLPETLRGIGTEAEVRDAVRGLNRRIAEHLVAPHGPRVPVAPVDVDAAVDRWRHGAAARTPPPGTSARPDDAAAERPSGPFRRWRNKKGGTGRQTAG